MTNRNRAFVSVLLAAVFLLASGAHAAPRQGDLAVEAPASATSGSEITVTVSLKADGSAVEGASVYLEPRSETLSDPTGKNAGDSEAERILLGTTDAWGKVKSKVDEGRYFLVAEKEGYKSAYSPITVSGNKTELSLTTDKRVYSREGDVEITFENCSQTAVTLNGDAPWTISRPDGTLVYAPVATEALVEVKPGESKTWTWDLTDDSGTQVKPGVYVITLTIKDESLTAKVSVQGLRFEKHARSEEPEMPEGRPFADVDGSVSWGDPHILRLAERNIVRGRNGTAFEPDGTLTRAEFLALLLRAGGLEPGPDEGQDAFVDVTPNHWAYAIVSRAREMGLITPEEYPEGFGPDVPITRMEIAVMATRALGLDHEAGSRAGEDLAFRDCEEVRTEYRGYVASAVEWDILRGYDDNTFQPYRNATRREACVIIYRMLGE